MNDLAARSRAGTLEADEEIEIESYRLAARLLEILKLRARATIKQSDQRQSPSAQTRVGILGRFKTSRRVGRNS
jgi:hypothetical protein